MVELRRPPLASPVTPAPSDFRKVIHEALKSLRKESTTTSALHTTRLFKTAQQTLRSTPQAAISHLLEQGLQDLGEKFDLEAKILRQHFSAGKAIQAIATELNMAEGTVYNKQSEALTHLADLLFAQEDQLCATYRRAQENRLPPPANSNPVGLEPHLSYLVDQLCTPGAPWLIALAGIGGIGKTTLADAVARQAIRRDYFDDVGWVTAKQHIFSGQSGLRGTEQPALGSETLIRTLINQLLPELPITPTMTRAQIQQLLNNHLSQGPHLILIDNLETVTDIETLLDTLHDLANPTKFLLTSRSSLFGESDVYHFPVPELTRELALNLIRQEARLRNLPDLLAASEADLQPIVDTVGGNPLAIRLVIGQSHIYPLALILENLHAARGQTTEQFYTYIYRQAWDALDENARRILLVMPLVSNLGGTVEHIQKVCQLDLGTVTDALAHLVRINLVDSRGDLKSRRYTIHNLTTTFLQEQVIRWGTPQ